MARKNNDYGTGIPRWELQPLAYVLLKSIQDYYESEDGKATFDRWCESHTPIQTNTKKGA